MEGLQALRAGEADALTGTWQVVSRIAEAEGIEVYNAGPTGHEYHLSFGYRSDQPLLGSILQKVLDGIPASQRAEIFEPLTSGGAALDLTAAEEAWLAESPVIRVAYEPTWFPIEYVDESGQLAGATAEYITLVGDSTGADLVQAQITDWTHALESIRDRSADIMFMVADTEERRAYMGFTTPHTTIATSLATLEEGELDIEEEGLRIITNRNFAIEDWLDENRPDVDYISVDSFAEGLALLQDGDADAYAATWPVVYRIAELDGIQLYNAGPTGHKYDLTIGYRSDQPLLGSIMQKALDDIPESVRVEMIESLTAGSGIGLTAEERSWLAENPAIQVAYDPGWFPIEYVDESGRLSGVTAQYVGLVEAATGADLVEAQITSWTHALESIRDRNADIMFMVADTEERREYMSFTTPHTVMGTSLLTLENRQLELNEELRILTIRNYAVEDWLDENHPEIDYISVDSFAEGFEVLQAGEGDALIGVWEIVSHIAEVEGITLYDAGPAGYEYVLNIGYRNDQPVLGSILQKALDSIPASARADMIELAPAYVAASELTGAERSWLAENPIITMAYDPGWVPIEYLDEDGMVAGATARYVELAEAATGADFVEAQITSWSHALKSVRDRSADVVFMAEETAPRSEYMGFTTPHSTVSTSLIALEDVSLEMTEGLRILTVRDYAIEDWLDENFPRSATPRWTTLWRDCRRSGPARPTR